MNDVTKTGEITTVDNYNKYPEEYNSGSQESEMRKRIKIFRFGIRGPANIRKQNASYKVVVGEELNS
tara:strand:+ start:144 stop:344 length:201 start_codon:yes stop_codon:yes gene_type:complete